MLIGDMTAVKYQLNCNCLSQSITRSGLQDVVRRTVAKCEQYTVGVCTGRAGEMSHGSSRVRRPRVYGYTYTYLYKLINDNWWYLFITLNAAQRESFSHSGPSHWVTCLRRWVTLSPSCSVKGYAMVYCTMVWSNLASSGEPPPPLHMTALTTGVKRCLATHKELLVATHGLDQFRQSICRVKYFFHAFAVPSKLSSPPQLRGPVQWRSISAYSWSDHLAEQLKDITTISTWKVTNESHHNKQRLQADT